MPGTTTNSNAVIDTVQAFSLAAVTAAQVLTEFTAPFAARIAAVVVNGTTAGTGVGNTVLDVMINGVTAYTTTANRPTLLATATGAFANVNPDIRAIRAGNVIQVKVASVSTTGHAMVSASVALSRA